MFYGTEDLYFTDEEVNLITDGEARRRPRQARTVYARPHQQPQHVVHFARPPVHRPDSGAAVLIGLALAGLFVFGLLGSMTNTQSQVSTQSGSARPSLPAPPRVPPRTHGVPATSSVSEAGPPVAPPPAAPRVSESLPVGWKLGTLRGEVDLREFPQCNSQIVTRLRAGTEDLYRKVGDAGNCWHAVVLMNGETYGYACLRVQEPDDSIAYPLPEGWRRVVFASNGPAGLYGPLHRFFTSQLQPGSEVVVRRIGNTDSHLAISADGLSWGFGQFQDVLPRTDFSLKTAALAAR